MSFVSALAAIGITGTAGAIGGGILTGASIGAGVGGLGSALSGGDFLEGMGTGALGGAITGGIGSGLGAAGSAVGSAGTAPAKLFEGMSSPISAPATQATALANSSPVMTSSGVNSMFNSMGSNTGASLLSQTQAPLSSALPSAPMMSSVSPTVDRFAASPLVENAVMPSIGKEGITGTLGELGTAYNEMSPLKRAAFLGQVGLGVSSMLSPLSGGSSVMSQPEEPSSVIYDPMAITKARRRFAEGGIASLGSYSDGGQLLKGPGDGVSDDIPATIEGGQPARLADGEFVVPARIVSELGNGSTDAGARRLYEMVDRVQEGRKKTTKKGTHAKDTKAYKHLPA